MSAQLRASVRRIAPGQWFVRVALTGPLATVDQACAVTAPSHPEAMQLAWLKLAQLDDELMDAVNESRAARRERRCECAIGMHSIHCPDHDRNQYPMEPTA